MILLLKFTSRERPGQLRDCIEHHIKLANKPDELKMLVSLDVDDFNKNDYTILANYPIHIALGERSNKIGAINRDVPHYGWDILMNVSDDQFPLIQGYDDIIRKEMTPDLDLYLWFPDGAQGRINTQEILGYNYYKRFGYIYNPGYKSFFCDNESTKVAQMLGKLKKCKHQIVEHRHPCVNQNFKSDALYKLNDKYWKEDEAFYQKRLAENFGF